MRCIVCIPVAYGVYAIWYMVLVCMCMWYVLCVCVCVVYVYGGVWCMGYMCDLVYCLCVVYVVCTVCDVYTCDVLCVGCSCMYVLHFHDH